MTGTRRNGTIAVIGLGNDRRGDDGAGPAVARALKDALPPPVRVIEHDGEVAGLVELLGDARAAILVDAALSGAAPGAIRILDAAAAPLPGALFACSTHALGLAEAVELARALGRLPATCRVYAIEAESLEHGEPLSPAVAGGVAEAVRRIRDDVDTIVGTLTEAPSDA